MTAREERIHTIKDFLSRPIIITTGLWSSTAPAETQLFTTNFPEALISNAMYRAKLTGFVGLRATLVVKVQVNSQPFQQGRLMLQYFPYAQYMPNRVALVNATLQGRSGCPRTDLDLSVGTEIEMRIPYVSPHVYYNLITGQGSFGSIYLVVYSQLRDQVTGTGSVEYTVWAHLEDVDIQYPTGANVFTGNAPNIAKVQHFLEDGTFNKNKLKEILEDEQYSQPTSKIFAQVKSEAQEMNDSGVISKGVGVVSSTLNALSRIPILGNVFTRPAWISREASNIFKMLGFSKPTSQVPACENKLRGQNRMMNFDGVDTSHKMALSAQNEIETKEGLSGTTADEMDLTHVLSIPNFWDRFTWSTTNQTNNVLWTNYVTPFKIKNFSNTITDRFRCTHMGYLANAHGFWRGSLVYTFKFVKTQFHSGRLRISFIPFYYNNTISLGAPDVSRTQKIVVDLRTSTEVSFTVPYVSSRPWMFCIRPESPWIGANNDLMYNAVTGIVQVEVLNQLVAANNVFQSIDTIVEVSGGPDLTFAAPTSPSYVPYSGTFTRENKDKIVAQVMGENEAIPRNEAQHGQHPQAIDTHQIAANWSPEAHCIGEKVMSIRQLIKRFGSIANLQFSVVNTSMLIAPFSVPAPNNTPGLNKNISNFEYYYYLYAFWRGSMRIKAAIHNSDPQSDKMARANDMIWNVNMINSVQDTFDTLALRFSNGSLPVQTSTQLPNAIRNMGSSVAEIPNGLEGIVEFEVPYYNISHISPATVYPLTEKPIDVPKVLKGHVPPTIVTLSTTASNSFPAPIAGDEVCNAKFYRAAGDDFSFMYLVGVPPLVNVNRPS